MYKNKTYQTYSEYLQGIYGEKVYKLPVNLPVTCPNRIDGGGCTFCAEVGTGFEALDQNISVQEQMNQNKAYISKKYHAKKFIAYFQNFTNTFLPLEKFQEYILEAVKVEDVVEISVSTRPDCIAEEYLDFLEKVKEEFQIAVTIELGLQTVNYHSLDKINRGHGLAEFIDAVLRISRREIPVCAHVILNLPYDDDRDALESAKILSALPVKIVKLHSLYIPGNTVLSKLYEDGTITICSKEQYLDRLVSFVEHIRPDMVVERLFSRVPEEDAVFSNWGTSWWKLQDEFMNKMQERNSVQGCRCTYLNGAALKKL